MDSSAQVAPAREAQDSGEAREEKLSGAEFGVKLPSAGAMVALYSASHFLVDFACIYIVYRIVFLESMQRADASGIATVIIIYNFCAFALQMPLGPVVDKLNKNALVAALACVMVAVSYFAFSFSADGIIHIAPAAIIIIAGAGNALFHLGGGVDVLNISTRKSGMLGVFVSPGAFGVFFGVMLSKQGTFWIPALTIVLLLISSALIILRDIAARRSGSRTSNEAFDVSPGGREFIPAILVLAVCGFFAVVVLRSWVGTTFSPAWKSAPELALLLVCAVVGGKAAGGFIADKIGMRRAAVLSLGAAAVLFLFAGAPAAGIAAIFFFNMTMPITLWAMARVFRGAKGFAFGLLCFGLFAGTLPAFLMYPSRLENVPDAVFTVAAAVSLAVLAAFLIKRVTGKESRESRRESQRLD